MERTPERIAYEQAYYLKTKDTPEYRARQRQYYLDNRDKLLTRDSELRRTTEGWARSALRTIRHRAKINGMECTITYLDILPPEYCPVLGIKLEVNSDRKSYLAAPNSPSVDRFDNNKGYTKENVRVICNRANLLKRDASVEEIRAILKYMEGAK